MAHIAEFNEATAQILSKLYESFPKRTAIQVAEFAGDPDTAQLFGDTFLFLAKEGFVSYEIRSGNKGFYDVSLTLKGLAILNSVPDALQDKETLGERLNKAVSAGSKEVVNNLIGQLVQAAVTGFFKAHSM